MFFPDVFPGLKEKNTIKLLKMNVLNGMTKLWKSFVWKKYFCIFNEKLAEAYREKPYVASAKT